MSLRSLARGAFVALTSFAWIACGGDAASPGSTSGPTASPPASSASFARIQAEILNTSCATANCHAGASASSGLALTPDVAYEQLLGVTPANPNAVADGLRRVMPGKPDSSLLYHKLVFPPGHHVHDYGNSMPSGTQGLTVGQLEYVRQWIAAGAPKTGNVADSTLLADKSVQTTQPFAPLDPPAAGAGYQMKVDRFDVSANFERELFNYRKVGNTADIYVSRIQTSMRPFSHHFVLYTFASNTPSLVIPPLNAVRDIRNTDGTMNYANMVAMGYHVFLAGSMTSQMTYDFPAGTALRLPADAAVDLNVHYANHSAALVPGEAYVNLYTVPASQVVHPLSTLNLSNTNITLPAGLQTIVTKDFTFNATTTITGLTSHMHARGTKFQIRIVGGARDGEVVYENTDWAHPAMVNYPQPIVLTKGQGFRSVVTYNNTTSTAIFFGLTSDDEMDIIFGYYY